MFRVALLIDESAKFWKRLFGPQCCPRHSEIARPRSQRCRDGGPSSIVKVNEKLVIAVSEGEGSCEKEVVA